MCYFLSSSVKDWGGVLTFLSKVLFGQIQVWSSVVSKKLESNALSGSGKTMHRILWNQNFSCGLFYVDLLPATQMAVIAPSCQRLDPGAYHCHFLTACQVHCGHVPSHVPSFPPNEI